MNNNILPLIFKLEEYYLLEQNYQIFQIKENTILNIKQIRLTCESNGNCKEVIIEKEKIDNMYAPIKIFDSNKKNYINIYINKQEIKNNKNDILNRINKKQFFKGAFIINFKIKEFPLKNYILEEEVNNNGLAEKIYILKQNINLFCCSDEFKKYFPSIGLDNVGLTCYMNSTLQCLLHIPELISFFINIYPKQKNELRNLNSDVETKGYLSSEFYKLVQKIDVKNREMKYNHYYNYNYNHNYNYNSVSPKEFNNALSQLNPQFSKYESNDSKDLLLYLIQSMHAELNYYGDKKLTNVPKCNQLIQQESFNFFVKVNSDLNLSVFSYLFYGILISNTKCSGCKNILYNYQYFQFLSFPSFNFDKKDFNIYQGLKEYIKPETMKGDNQCYCQKCKGLRNAKVTSKLFYIPPYLIINIDYGKDKIYKPKKVEFGEIIDLKDFTEQNDEALYELIGISTHIGRSGNSGHYIAYCKNINNNKWYKFNDSIVEECKFTEVNSNSPYLLLFQKLKISNY